MGKTAPWKYNMLTGVAGGRALTCSEPVWKGVIIMYVTWSELIAFVAMLTGVIALVMKIHKK
ncbi:MAG: hypothetical protein MR922_07885 [Lachnospiraceae bacterium]|nr:hypothetical protein [Lachnospiraceae bacterium]